jgi:hypothetical protein
MATCKPYFYIIGWNKSDTWYAGCRYASKASPTDFWKTYFTSSKYVKAYREENGEPDYKLVIPFPDAKEVLAYEKHFLSTRFRLPNWLNKNCSAQIDTTDPVVREKISKTKTGTIFTEQHRNNISKAQLKRQKGANRPECYISSSEKQKGVPKPQSQATKDTQKLRMKQWWAERKAKNGNL